MQGHKSRLRAEPSRGARRAPLLVTLLLAAGCGGGSNAPSPARTATIQVSGERYRIALTTPELVAAAEAAKAGTGPRIPNGRIVMGTGVNTGWAWHVEDVQFADLTIELCDGRPSDVERLGTAFGGGRFCPWGARVTAIE
jgi:hypothetical protein